MISQLNTKPNTTKGTATKKAEKSAKDKLVKTKSPVVVKTVAHQAVKKTSVHDEALKSISEESNHRHG